MGRNTFPGVDSSGMKDQFSIPQMLNPTDRGDADVTLTAGVDDRVQRFGTTLTANRTVTINVTGAQKGDWFRIVRTGLGAFTLTVRDSVPTSLKVIASATAAFVDAHFDGTAWRLTGYGAL